MELSFVENDEVRLWRNLSRKNWEIVDDRLDEEEFVDVRHLNCSLWYRRGLDLLVSFLKVALWFVERSRAKKERGKWIESDGHCHSIQDRKHGKYNEQYPREIEGRKWLIKRRWWWTITFKKSDLFEKESDVSCLLSLVLIRNNDLVKIERTKQQTMTMKTKRIKPAMAPTNGTQRGKRGTTSLSDRLANSAGVVA